MIKNVNLLSFINENYNKNTHYRTLELLQLSKQIYQLEINNITQFECDHFIINKYTLPNKRSYLVKTPKNSNNITKCILFFHGSRDLHWDCALLSTNLISNKYLDYIIVYLQGNNQGVFNLEEPHLHPQYGYISYGENFFEIRDSAINFTGPTDPTGPTGPTGDINYVKEVKENIKNKYNTSEFFAIGHSNGGVFLTLFPIYLPGEFSKLISHQGGMGYDEYFNIPFHLEKKLDNNFKLPDMLFYTGTEDIHFLPCVQAHNIFLNEGFNSEIYIEKGLKHTWRKCDEWRMLDFLFSNKI